jgi:hypothetical protein
MRISAPLILAIVLLGGGAQAAEPDESQAEATPAPALNLAPPWRLQPGEATTARVEERSWYGYQLILSDVISFAAFSGAAFAEFFSCPFVLFGTTPPPSSGSTFLFAPAIIHLAHGQAGAAGGSILLRLVLPVSLSVLTGLPPVGAIALLAGVIVDDAFLSSEPRKSIEQQGDIQAGAWPPLRDH